MYSRCTNGAGDDPLPQETLFLRFTERPLSPRQADMESLALNDSPGRPEGLQVGHGVGRFENVVEGAKP